MTSLANIFASLSTSGAAIAPGQPPTAAGSASGLFASLLASGSPATAGAEDQQDPLTSVSVTPISGQLVPIPPGQAGAGIFLPPGLEQTPAAESIAFPGLEQTPAAETIAFPGLALGRTAIDTPVGLPGSGEPSGRLPQGGSGPGAETPARPSLDKGLGETPFPHIVRGAAAPPPATHSQGLHLGRAKAGETPPGSHPAPGDVLEPAKPPVPNPPQTARAVDIAALTDAQPPAALGEVVGDGPTAGLATPHAPSERADAKADTPHAPRATANPGTPQVTPAPEPVATLQSDVAPTTARPEPSRAVPPSPPSALSPATPQPSEATALPAAVQSMPRPSRTDGQPALADAPGEKQATESAPPAGTRPSAAPPAPTLLPRPGINSVFGATLVAVQENGPGDDPAGPVMETSANVTAQARPVLITPPGALAQQLPVNALAVHIAAQAQNGIKRFNIRLDPPELGRVDVRLDVGRDGHVTTHLVVERAETLDLLQRDARALERALNDAGLKTSDDSLTFSLKDHGQTKDQPGANTADAEAAGSDEPDRTDDDDAAETERGPGRAYIATSGLDIRI